MQCYDAAAEKFGWSKRNPKPGMTRDGDWLIGMGCATACYPSSIGPAGARVLLRADGTAKVEIAGHEIGTGTYTVVAIVASSTLGIPVDKIEVAMGDTALPASSIAGGSNQTASMSHAVAKAC